uniref:Conotoxin n=1 Tax=Conus betulinus TaxID=89764 RepID=A0A142C1J5_CONBE|nr:conotoxin [Conus betulinus]
MMWKMGVMLFVVFLLFPLASLQQEGDIQAKKIDLKSNFYGALERPARDCRGTCGHTDQCTGTCECDGYDSCTCSNSGQHSGCTCSC